MNTSLALPNTLLGRIHPAFELSGARQMLIVLLASVALAISAKITVPLGPVPFTMQTYVVRLLGVLLGRRLGLAAVLAYIAEGLAGLPVFAQGAGLAYVLSPSFGYILGFALAVYVMGALTERGYGRGVLSSFTLMALGHALVFAVGCTWLATMVGLEKAYWAGLYPFLGVSLAKTVLACATVSLAWKKWGRA